MSSRAPRAAAVAALVVASLLAPGARAATDDVVPAQPQVRLHVAADALAADLLADAVRARLQPQDVSLAWDEVATIDAGAVLERGAAGVAPALAEVWLDARAPREVVLIILPGQGEGVLARRLVLPSGLDDVAQAELAYVVQRAVATLLAAEPFGVSKAAAHAALEGRAVEAPAPAAVAVAAPLPAAAEPAPRLFFHAGATGGAQTWSAAQPVLPAAGLFAEVERAVSWGRLGVALSAGLRGDARSTTPDAGVAVGGGDVHLWLTMAKALAGGALWRLSVGPGLFLDQIDVTPTVSSPRTVSVAAQTQVDLTLGAWVRRDLARLRSAVVFLSVGADVFPWPVRYTARVDGASTTLIQPWLVRPSFALGVAFGSR